MIDWEKVSAIVLEGVVSGLVTLLGILAAYYLGRRQSQKEFERNRLQNDIDQLEKELADNEIHLSYLKTLPVGVSQPLTLEAETKMGQLTEEIAALKAKQEEAAQLRRPWWKFWGDK